MEWNGIMKRMNCQNAKSFESDQYEDVYKVCMCHLTRCVFDNTLMHFRVLTLTITKYSSHSYECL